jgi:hypothetical protein
MRDTGSVLTLFAAALLSGCHHWTPGEFAGDGVAIRRPGSGINRFEVRFPAVHLMDEAQATYTFSSAPPRRMWLQLLVPTESFDAETPWERISASATLTDGESRVIMHETGRLMREWGRASTPALREVAFGRGRVDFRSDAKYTLTLRLQADPPLASFVELTPRFTGPGGFY